MRVRIEGRAKRLAELLADNYDMTPEELVVELLESRERAECERLGWDSLLDDDGPGEAE